MIKKKFVIIIICNIMNQVRNNHKIYDIKFQKYYNITISLIKKTVHNTLFLC